ncbi:MAG: U32 family peptidase [Candidatus Omnitrophica bacterium]|nr:U32 family peptidase [Candidatus Omnitrophota bacterium]MCK5287422.1 U32 family peptidase [Candidatus Omnitrophota bacterium]MCK5493700.1 U32 family peptidase [Candidatus Omnitrophota bacterium]
MQLIVPTNWDDSLIKDLEGLKVKEVFGKLQSDCFGGGRPSISLPYLTKKAMIRHIKIIHEQGYKFNYLLNSACMGNVEFTRKGQKKMRKFVDFLAKSGTDSVTVAIPYLANWINRNYPNIKVRASVVANIDSIEKAKMWDNFGVDSIVLNIDNNRSFSFLRLMKKAVKCKIVLMVNSACLYNCPLSQYHYTLVSHGSQSIHKLKGFHIDYCLMFCSWYRLTDLSQIIRSGWIRPEDLEYYEGLGINNFKIVGRDLSREKIYSIVRAYSERNYQGNLLDILSPFAGWSSFDFKKFIRCLKYMLRPSKVNIFKLLKLRDLPKKNFIFINNEKLKGFIEGFQNRNCKQLDCSDCFYCNDIAKKVIDVDYDRLNQVKRMYKKILEEIESGSMFTFKKAI